MIPLTRAGPRPYLQMVDAERDSDTGKPPQRPLAPLGRLEPLQEPALPG